MQLFHIAIQVKYERGSQDLKNYFSTHLCEVESDFGFKDNIFCCLLNIMFMAL